ncbi:MAG: hypothetical protein SFV19_19105 [Rhodospirillaceae bacterium]|nr:hypothetical protein [Rhodospirillaceae bacterium]
MLKLIFERDSKSPLTVLGNAMSIFDVTPEDIASLSDEDLRNLIGRLCEAELGVRGLPVASVTYGGNQTASDGGLDVRVELPSTATIDGYIPRNNTGFQVKACDMPRAEILEEMKPKGALRASILDLASKNGAYVIVSSKGSVTDSALSVRRTAMSDALIGATATGALLIDFFDRTRLASWVRAHPGVVLWVREKIGRSLTGWRPYESWANPSEQVTAEYLVDDGFRIKGGTEIPSAGLSVVDGIQNIRRKLGQSGISIRLVGLSGVGKTRFVQALFDERIGNDALDKTLAIYTNLADNPNPQPVAILTDLVASNRRAVLIVDNCPPDLHRRLTEICKRDQCPVNVITVEYDIREDQPEGTEVVILEPSTAALIEKLVPIRYPNVTAVDARTISIFSGGNARIALTLASSVDRGGELSELNDEDLFRRLFDQRHDKDSDLLTVAQACSLVYSFEGEDLTSSDSELVRLAAVVGKTSQEIYTGLAELKRRDLLQSRGRWRAILPHAVANRLAALALQNNPLAKIEEHIANSMAPRMLKSFSRRVGFLHDRREARSLVARWMAPGEMLADIGGLSDLGQEIFVNLAPVDTEGALSALERLLSEEDGIRALKKPKYVRLLKSIAYEQHLFERCCKLLVAMVEDETVQDRSLRTQAFEACTSLFHCVLSGTYASISQRVNLVRSMLQASSSQPHALGIACLKALLKTSLFSASFTFDFGARPRDFGFKPKNRDEFQAWYSEVVALALELAVRGDELGSVVRNVIAENIRGLWRVTELYDQIERLCLTIRLAQFWTEGWIAVRTALFYDGKSLAPTALARLQALERTLRPKDLFEQVLGQVLSTTHVDVTLDLDNVYGAFSDEQSESASLRLERNEALAFELGQRIAKEQDMPPALLERLVGGEGRIWSFARGLADGSKDLRTTWTTLARAFVAAEESKRSFHIRQGFLSRVFELNPHLAHEFLDLAIQDKVNGCWCPTLETSITLDKRSVERLLKSLGTNLAPIHLYRTLAFGRVIDSIDENSISELVVKIGALPNGFDVAREILEARIRSDKDAGREISPEIVNAAKQLLALASFEEATDLSDYHLARVIESCLVGHGARDVAVEITRKIAAAIASGKTHGFVNREVVKALLKAQPQAVLDALFGDSQENTWLGIELLDADDEDERIVPMDSVSSADLIEWCQSGPANRWLVAAAIVPVIHEDTQTKQLEWPAIALDVLRSAPDPGAIVRRFAERLRPSSWTGSLGVKLLRNSRLLGEIERSFDPAIALVAAEERARLVDEALLESRREATEDTDRDERFE